MGCPFDPTACVTTVAKAVAGDAFGAIAAAFGRAADAAINWLWAQIGSATAVSLGGAGFGLEVGIVASIAGVVAVGLFVIQLATSTLRRDPGGLARAGKGLVVAFLGAGVAIGTLDAALRAVDDLSAGVVQVATGGSITQMGHTLLSAGAITAATANPAGILLLSLGALAAVVIVWAALMVRKVLIVVTAVFAPLAFAGSVADVTVSWARRWIETTAALVVAKLVLVVIFVVGLGMVSSGVGQAGSGATQSLTQTVSGLLVLALAGLAPWMALRIVHFVGDQAQSLHLLATHSTAGAQRVYSAAQKARPWVAPALAGARVGAPGGSNGARPQPGQTTGSPARPEASPPPGPPTPTGGGGSSPPLPPGPPSPPPARARDGVDASVAAVPPPPAPPRRPPVGGGPPGPVSPTPPAS
ncbi:MAG TPA: hypothetical protein VFA11_13230 [Acidimicrobiales bacterium]|nr:hypothetical protein [Acidimicrobiales bacterium]